MWFKVQNAFIYFSNVEYNSTGFSLDEVYLCQCVQQKIRRDIVKHTVGGHQNHVAVQHRKAHLIGRLGPIPEHVVAVTGRRQRQLKRRVEVVLLLFGSMHDLAASHHHEATVADVGRVHSARFAV